MWSIRQASGPQTIYYKAQFLVDPQANAVEIPPTQPITKPAFDGPEESAAIALIDSASQRSADHVTFARELIKGLNDLDGQ